MTDSADPIDVRLGELLRLARNTCRMSQERLGALNGLTFQQIQKYERGKNRVSVSRLMHMAECMGVSATSFIEKLVKDRSIEEQGFKVDLTFVHWREAQELLRNYTNIADKNERRYLRLITALLANRVIGGGNDQQ